MEKGLQSQAPCWEAERYCHIPQSFPHFGCASGTCCALPPHSCWYQGAALAAEHLLASAGECQDLPVGRSLPWALLPETPQEFWSSFLCSLLSTKMPFTLEELSWGPEIGSCCGATPPHQQPSAPARARHRPRCRRRGGSSSPGQTRAAPGGAGVRCYAAMPERGQPAARPRQVRWAPPGGSAGEGGIAARQHNSASRGNMR